MEDQDEIKPISSLARRFIEQLAVPQRSIRSEEEQELSELLEQMVLRYPHQDMSTAIRGYYHDYVHLTMRYGLDVVRLALQELRLMPGQRFFPQPSECSEVAEAIVKQRKEEQAKRSVFVPCGACYSGLVRAEREDKPGFCMRECQCLQDHKAGIRNEAHRNVIDFKTRSGGDTQVA